MLVTLTNDQKVRSLVALHATLSAEITRYRDYEWRVPAWGILVLVGLGSLLDRVTVSEESKLILKTLLVTFAAALASYCLIYLHMIHARLTKNRRWRRTVERILQFCDRGAYTDSSVLPEAWKAEHVKYSSGVVAHLVPSWFLTVAAGIYAVVTIINW